MTISKCPVSKALQYANEVLNPAKRLSDISTKFVDFAKSLGEYIPADSSTAIGGTRFVSFGTGLLINLPKTIASLARVVTSSEQAARVQAIWDSISNAVSTFMDAVNIAKALEAVGAVSKDAVQWASVAGKVLYPVMCIGVGLHIYDMKQFAAFYDKMKKNVLDKTRTEELTIQNLTDVCTFIEKKKDKIYKHLGFSKDMVLDGRFKRIRETIEREETTELEKQQALNEAKTLLRIMRARVHAKVGFNIASTVIKIGYVVSAGVGIFGVTTPGAIGASMALSVADLVLYAAQKIALPENPLDENIWQYRAIRWVKNIPNSIQSSFQQIASKFQREPIRERVLV